jgi:hypothetical protein
VFIHDNGNLHILSATRCGHTSMARYFRKIPHLDIGELSTWLNSSSRKILVLRNPYDRLQSALINAEAFPYGLSNVTETKEEWIRIHSYPYLIDIPQTTPFEIIDFYRLSEYIPMSRDTITTNTSKIHHKNITITPEMREEYKRYRYYLTYCKQISPEEWKQLTP